MGLRSGEVLITVDPESTLREKGPERLRALKKLDF